MNLNKIALVSSLVVSGIAVSSIFSSANAASVTVDVGGKSYDVTTVTDTFDNQSTLLESQPWYGNITTAGNFATAVGKQLGFPNLAGLLGPLFAYSTSLGSVYSYVYASPTSAAGIYGSEQADTLTYAIANPTSVTVNGYNVSFIYGALNDGQSLPAVMSSAWWGDAAKAASFAKAVKNSLDPPYFAYSINGTSVDYYQYFQGNVIQGSVSTSSTETYATSTAAITVPEPLNILGSITGLILFGTVSTALKRRKLSK